MIERMTSRRRLAAQRGFTLIEVIIAIVVTGIISGMVATFMVLPIQGYIDSSRRADITELADGALRRIAFDLRGAVPNTVRIDATGMFLEFVPASDGGRYRAALASDGSGNILNATSAVDTAFDVLGPNVTGAANDFVVIFNTGQTGLDAYAGLNRRTLSAAAGATVTFAATGVAFPPFESPSQRFQIVPSTGPVTYACTGAGTAGGNGTGALRRHTGYGFNPAQPVAGLGNGWLLADNLSACTFTYAAVSAANGLLTLRLEVTRNNETIALHRDIHVDNTP